jgi:hypothetical protein
MKEHCATRDAIVLETAKAQQAIDARLTGQVKALGVSIGAEADSISFLSSLKFPEMKQRYNDLLNSSEASFKGVFKSYREMTSNDTELKGNVKMSEGFDTQNYNHNKEKIDLTWANFVDWLKSSDSLFCIRGKPGSGKSTLVKFIVDNKNTKQLLSHEGSEAIVLSHFFWKIGSSPQNSIKGLLCSFTYQVLGNDREMLKQILDRFRHLSSHSHYHDWSTEELKALLYFILENAKCHTCIFIDGLDEICNTDGLSKLTRSIEELLQFTNVKICVASRPETLIMKWLNKMGVPGILLEDLTRPDMTDFVRKELAPFLSSNTISTEIHKTFTLRLVAKAQGVFLWLYLATRSVTTGLQSDDSETMLLARLKEMPSELTQLYTDMWQRLNDNNPVYRGIAARYFTYALAKPHYIVPIFPEVGFPSGFPEVWQPTLFQIACAERAEAAKEFLSTKNAITWTAVKHVCEQATTSIEHRCAGLLRVVQRSGRGRTIKSAIRASHGKILDDSNGTDEVEAAIFGSVVFIHRTAHDFLKDTETGQDILKFASLTQRERDFHLLKGLLCLLRFLHSEYGLMGRSTTIFGKVIHLYKSGDDRQQEEMTEFLKTLQDIYRTGAIGSDRELWQPQAPFLSHLTDHRELDDYVIASLSRTCSKTLATDILREAWDPDLSLYYNNGKSPSLRLIEAMISLGGDPHIYGVNWRQSMGRMEPFLRQGTAFSNLLLSFVNSIDDGKYLDGAGARETCKAALIMAMTCPDLSATTLILGGVNGSDQSSLYNLTWLKRLPVREKPSLLFEVDFKFLLLHILSWQAQSIESDFLDSLHFNELLKRLQSPTARLRLIITIDNDSDDTVCHQIPPGLASTPEVSEIIDSVFPPTKDLRNNPRPPFDELGGGPRPRFAASEKINPVHRLAMRIIEDSNLERIDLESAMVSLSKEKIGFCTFSAAGIIPTPPYLEYLEANLEHNPFPTMIAELRKEAARSSEAEQEII